MIENMLKLKQLNEEFLRLIRAGRFDEADAILDEIQNVQVYHIEEEVKHD